MSKGWSGRKGAKWEVRGVEFEIRGRGRSHSAFNMANPLLENEIKDLLHYTMNLNLSLHLWNFRNRKYFSF